MESKMKSGRQMKQLIARQKKLEHKFEKLEKLREKYDRINPNVAVKAFITFQNQKHALQAALIFRNYQKHRWIKDKCSSKSRVFNEDFQPIE